MISTFLLLTTKCHADISFTVLNVIGKGQSKMKQNKKQKTRRQQNKTNKQNTKQNTKISESQIMYPSNTYRKTIFHHHSCQLANLKLTVSLLMTDVIKKQTKNKRENSKCLLNYIPGRL
jgi:hypothetical protein